MNRTLFYNQSELGAIARYKLYKYIKNDNKFLEADYLFLFIAHALKGIIITDDEYINE